MPSKLTSATDTRTDPSTTSTDVKSAVKNTPIPMDYIQRQAGRIVNERAERLLKEGHIREMPIYRIMAALYLVNPTFEEAQVLYLKGVRVGMNGKLYFVKPGDWRL